MQRPSTGYSRTSRALVPVTRRRPPPQIYLGSASPRLGGLYQRDHIEARHGVRLRWLMSTCLAGAVGVGAFAAVIYGSSDKTHQGEGFLPNLEQLTRSPLQPLKRLVTPKPAAGLNWVLPKQDRLKTGAAMYSARHIIHDRIPLRRGQRDYIQIKPYIRIVARLSAASQVASLNVPPFNPFKLYANSAPIRAAGSGEGINGKANDGQVAVNVVELLGGILPGSDGQELSVGEVQKIVTVAHHDAAPKPVTPALATTPAPLDQPKKLVANPPEPSASQTVLVRTLHGRADDDAAREIRTARLKSGQTLASILSKMGVEDWQARKMVETTRRMLPGQSLTANDILIVALQPSPIDTRRMEPVVLTVRKSDKSHRVTVVRNDGGEYVGFSNATPRSLSASAKGINAGAEQATVYASLYRAALTQRIPPGTITRILRIHAYTTDFRQIVKAGDSIEFFFDLKEDDKGADSPPGELLVTTIKSSGRSKRFYRFRTNDGHVDFYDERGRNSKKFLMRKPIKSAQARLTSGYGMRKHPLLGTRRMHTGIDWAAPYGTPILAAGNGTIEEARWRSGNGRYIRIRHANGYKTSYSHMRRFAAGVSKGVKVRQGQVIGYVGTTGLSSGPHLHYEIFVNNSFVNPLRIHVPRGRRLKGKELTEFQKERKRLEALMRRRPIMTRVAQAGKLK